MSDFLQNFLSKDINFHTKISNYETEFSSGVLFGELLKQLGIIKDLSNFNPNPDNTSEKKYNFSLVKEGLKKINVHLTDILIKEIIMESKWSAQNLLYKIKIQLERNKINFDGFLNKILTHEEEEKKDILPLTSNT